MQTQAKINGTGDLREGGGPVERPEEGKQYLIFREGNFTLALGLASIKKLYDAESFPPRTPGTRLLDLHDLMGAEYVAKHGYWIEMEAGSNRYLMPVEVVEGIRELSLAIVMPFPPVLRRPELSYIRGIFFDGLRMIVELNPEELAGTSDGVPAPRLSPGPSFPEGSRAGAKKAGDDDRTMVLFEAGGETWAVDLAPVVQIVVKDEVHPIPASGRGIMGAVYYADQAVPVIAPSTLREIADGGKGDGKDAFTIVLVAETPHGLIGFGCDRVVRVERPASAPDIAASAAREVRIEDVLKFLA